MFFLVNFNIYFIGVVVKAGNIAGIIVTGLIAARDIIKNIH